MRISDYLIHYLNARGIRYLFGVSGANIEDIFNQSVCDGLSIKPILAKHEFSAASMADGYGLASNSLGVVVSTSGAGALNLVPALAECAASQHPVLAIIGLPPTFLNGLGAFQDTSGLNHTLEGDKIFKPLASKYFHSFQSAEKFPEHLERAVEMALTPPFGTSILLIPKNFQLETIVENIRLDKATPALKKPFYPHETLDDNLIAECKKMQNKVLMILGEGSKNTGVQDLVTIMAEKLNALVAVSPEGMSSFDHHSPRFVGLTGTAGHQSVFDAAKGVEALIIIGTRLQLMSRAGLEPFLETRKIIYINHLSPSYDFKNPEKQQILIGDIENILGQIIAKIPSSKQPPKKGSLYFEPARSLSTKVLKFNFETIFLLFNKYIKKKEVIFADAGNTGGAALHYLRTFHDFGIALGMGGMGYAIGASIGSCLSHKKTTWCFLGDGSLLMHGLEIHTAIENNLPIRFIIFNNNAHAMCYTRDILYLNGKSQFNIFKKSYFGKGFSTMFPDFYAKDVDNLFDLENHLHDLKDYQKPALLSLMVDFQELPPFLPFIQQLKGI